MKCGKVRCHGRKQWTIPISAVVDRTLISLSKKSKVVVFSLSYQGIPPPVKQSLLYIPVKQRKVIFQLNVHRVYSSKTELSRTPPLSHPFWLYSYCGESSFIRETPRIVIRDSREFVFSDEKSHRSPVGMNPAICMRDWQRETILASA